MRPGARIKILLWSLGYSEYACIQYSAYCNDGPGALPIVSYEPGGVKKESMTIDV